MPTEVTVRYTLSDLYVITLNCWRRIGLRIALTLAALVAGLLLLFSAIDDTDISDIIRWFPWVFYGWLFLFLIVSTFGVSPLITYLHSKRRDFLGPHRLRLQEDGVQVESPDGRSTVYWSAILRCVVSQDRLLLYIRPVSALMLPKRDFADESSFEDAVRYATARWLEARASEKT